MTTRPVRSASIVRATRETNITLELTLDAAGKAEISTGFGFADHMLELIAFWGGLDLRLSCQGDMHIDAHHTLEDVGLCLGQALIQSLGDRAGIARVGWAKVPMDEAMADVAVDLSGRPYLVWNGDHLLPPTIASEEKDVWREFYKSLAYAGRFNLHIGFLYGLNGHHLLESAAKGLGLCLKQAAARVREGASSTKGSLD